MLSFDYQLASYSYIERLVLDGLDGSHRRIGEEEKRIWEKTLPYAARTIYNMKISTPSPSTSQSIAAGCHQHRARSDGLKEEEPRQQQQQLQAKPTEAAAVVGKEND